MMWTRIATWAASSRSTIQLILLAATIVAGGWAYIATLQKRAAECQAALVQAQQFENVANRLADELEKDRDARIEKIEDAPASDCLDANVDELLRDVPRSSG